MRDISKDELKETLRKNALWVECEEEGKRADRRGANLREAILRGASLRGADLWRADLRRANLDFSCWPLWCGSLDVKVDIRIAAQLRAAVSRRVLATGFQVTFQSAPARLSTPWAVISAFMAFCKPSISVCSSSASRFSSRSSFTFSFMV